MTINIFAQEEEWELETDEEGITIYTRRSKESNIKEFKAITTIDAPVEKILEYVKDVESYPDWISDIETTKLLEQKGKNEFYYYWECSASEPFGIFQQT